MPLAQPKRDNPLMRRYFLEIGLPGKRLAKRCGVSHSQIYMARKRNVGPNNAEKISRGVARILELPEEDRLELKAEITGYPGNLVRAWLGGPANAARLLGVYGELAEEIVDEEKSVGYRGGTRALAQLREMGAPAFVVESVDRRLRPPPEPRRGLITHNLHGPEMAKQRKRTREGLRRIRPMVYEALRQSSLSITGLREKAGVGKETVRKALYGDGVGARSAQAIAAVLGEGLSEGELRALEEELANPPRRSFRKNSAEGV